MKTAILGFSGCGKSTLARFLGEKYQIPVLHLDSVHFTANWVERPLEEKLADVRAFLDNNDSWVIDGNYSQVEDVRRLEEADTIILLELNRFVCLYRILKRWWTYKGQTRPDMAEGCLEKVDWEFVRWVLHDGRNAKKKAYYDSIAAKYPKKTIRIRTRKQQKELLDRETDL